MNTIGGVAVVVSEGVTSEGGRNTSRGRIRKRKCVQMEKLMN